MEAFIASFANGYAPAMGALATFAGLVVFFTMWMLLLLKKVKK